MWKGSDGCFGNIAACPPKFPWAFFWFFGFFPFSLPRLGKTLLLSKISHTKDNYLLFWMSRLPAVITLPSRMGSCAPGLILFCFVFLNIRNKWGHLIEKDSDFLKFMKQCLICLQGVFRHCHDQNFISEYGTQWNWTVQIAKLTYLHFFLKKILFYTCSILNLTSIWMRQCWQRKINLPVGCTNLSERTFIKMFHHIWSAASNKWQSSFSLQMVNFLSKTQLSLRASAAKPNQNIYL